jgi:hypothetical protein
MLLILDNASTGIGMCKEFASDDADFAATAIEGGLLGQALNDADDGEAVVVAMITPVSNKLRIKTYVTAPTAALLGVAQATLYTLRNDGGVPKINLGVTTNGVLRFLNHDWTDAAPYSVTDTGLLPTFTGDAGDYVYAVVPAAMRHWH